MISTVIFGMPTLEAKEKVLDKLLESGNLRLFTRFSIHDEAFRITEGKDNTIKSTDLREYKENYNKEYGEITFILWSDFLNQKQEQSQERNESMLFKVAVTLKSIDKPQGHENEKIVMESKEVVAVDERVAILLATQGIKVTEPERLVVHVAKVY